MDRPLNKSESAIRTVFAVIYIAVIAKLIHSLVLLSVVWLMNFVRLETGGIPASGGLGDQEYLTGTFWLSIALAANIVLMPMLYARYRLATLIISVIVLLVSVCLSFHYHPMIYPTG
jgi:hypothetical protein